MVKRPEKQGRRKERVQAERAGCRLRPRRGWAQPPEAMSPRPPQAHAGALLHSLLFFEDGFSCYLLKKIEL